MLSTKMRGVPSALWLLSLFSLVQAQLEPQRSYIYIGDSRVTADIVVWCITDVANIIITALCFIPILRLKEHRATYILLCLASFFTVVQSSINIGYNFFANNGADIPSVHKIAGLLSSSTFFGTWSSVLLYATLVILLHDRAKRVTRGALAPIDVALFYCGFAYIGVMLLVATVYVGLYAKSLALQVKFFDLEQLATVADALAVFHAEIQAQNASFAFSGFWFFTTVIVTALVILTFIRARRAGTYDQVTKSVLLFVVPLYYAAMIVGIVFTIFDSPSIIIISPIELQNITLANDLLTQFLYTGVMAVVLVLGLKTGSWMIRDHAVALSTLGAMPSGRYFELDDPQK